MTVATTTPTHAAVTSSLTIPRFRAWLESKDPREIVGKRRACGFCPVAEFLRAQFPGIFDLRVFEDTVRWGSRSAFIPAPKWVDAFIFRVDRDARATATAGHCLRILETLEKALA